MEFFEVVQARRSLRSYLDRPVELEKLKYVLESARLAPSWNNLQCWRFIVVEDAAGREALAESMEETNSGREVLMGAPIVIVLCAVPSESEVWEGKDIMMLDAGLAMEHLVLAATDRGLGACWQGMFSEEKARKALNVPDNVRVVAMSPLGYAAEEHGPRPRKAMTEIAYHEKWGQELNFASPK